MKKTESHSSVAFEIDDVLWKVKKVNKLDTVALRLFLDGAHTVKKILGHDMTSYEYTGTVSGCVIK